MIRFVLGGVMGLALLVAAPGSAGSAAPSAPCRNGNVSLTFDDGPSATVTPRLVRILRDLHAPATFFMVGERVATAPGAARLVARSGLVIANHSYRHTDMTRQTSGEVRRTLRATAARLSATGTRPTRLMRPPYGAINDRVRAAVHDVGMIPVLWDIDSGDWRGASGGTIAAHILAGLRPNRSNIVLQHDGIGNSPASVAAVPRVVREARRRGYCFVALDEQGRPGFPVPRAGLSVSDAGEGGTARATIRLDRPTARATTVHLRTRALSAVPGADYASRDVVVSFPAGRLRRSVSIPVSDDVIDERTERFRVTLSSPRGLTLGRAEQVVTVADNDRPPGVSVLDASVVEPVAGATTVNLRVSLTRPSGRTVHLTVTDVPGSATPGAGDYGRVDRLVTIRPGSRTALIPVTVYADDVVEADETCLVRIVSSDNARVVRRAAIMTIVPPVAAPA